MDFRHLLLRTSIALAVTTALVTLCYFFVDRPVAFYVHDHRINRIGDLREITLPPPIVQLWAPALLAVLVMRRAAGPFRDWERTLLAAGVAIILADQCRESISHLFGRDWPETWHNNNPSLIKDNQYGFHPFPDDSDSVNLGSFPSGHTARTASIAAVLAMAWPRGRWLAGLVVVVEAIALVGMNYHFVSDVIAGAFVGGTVGVYCAALAGTAPAPLAPRYSGGRGVGGEGGQGTR